MPLNMDYVRQAAEQIQQHEQQRSDGKRDIVNYKFKVGQNRGRFLPPWPGSGELAMHVWHHFGLPQLAGGKKHEFCYENMFPGRGIQCPICAVMRSLKARGVEAWRQNAVDIPRTNWIDRMPTDQFGQMIPLEKHPGPQLIDIKDKIFNYFINMAAQTGCDLTSLDLGYDVVINFTSNPDKQHDPGILPGQAQPLCQNNPELAKLWVSQMYDLRNIIKMPNWQSPDGQKTWERLCTIARELERSYLQGQGAVPGYAPQPPVGQFPNQMPGAQQPMFTQPTQQPVTAPPPMMAPNMMGQPGQVPFGAPNAPAPQAPPQMAPPPMAPPPMAPPVQTTGYMAPAAPQPPAAPPMMPPPPAPVAAPAPPPPQPPAPQPQAAPPPPMPPMQPQPPAQDNRPPWESAPLAPQAPPQPSAPLPSAPQPPAATMTQTSQDGKPPCFGKSRNDHSVTYQDKNCGWSPLPQEVGYRCTMCPHEIECRGKATSTFPQDYQGLSV